MGLYGEKKRQQEENERLRKKQEPSYQVKKLTAEEREAMLAQMQQQAKTLEEDKNIKLFGSKTIPDRQSLVEDEEDESKGKKHKDAKFLRNMGKDVYLESNMNLAERINRNAHYRDRDTARD